MSSLVNTLLIPRSSNRKTGPLPVTSRPEETCPSDCPFLPGGEHGGCYGTGRIMAMARRRATTMSVDDAVEAILAKRSPAARFLRDRIVGDVLAEDGTVDRDYLAGISEVGRRVGLQVFGYTHAWRRFTRGDVRFVRRLGYVMNASCETREDIHDAVGLGLLPVVVNDNLQDGEMIAGLRVVTCPAQTREATTCASCGLCARPQRACVVRFRIHGTGKAMVAAAVQAAERRAEQQPAA